MSQIIEPAHNHDAGEHELAGVLRKGDGGTLQRGELDHLVGEPRPEMSKASTKYAKATTANPGCSGK
jgi:hypothetical protein